jgi:hypothetical protein
MSNSTTTDSLATNPFFNTANVSTLPTSGSVFGALKYNINEKLGWMLGSPSATDIYLYSDLVFDNQNGYYDLASDSSNILFTHLDTTYPDQTLVKAVSTFMTFGDDVIQIDTYDPKDYVTNFASKDGLMGMTWLPWDVYGIKNKDGNYNVKHYYGNTVHVTCNPLRREVLSIKMFTLLKIFGISLGVYALIKLIIHEVKKKKI